MGYFTKFSDGAADILPLINLKKSQVFELGRYLNIPQNIEIQQHLLAYGKVKLMKMRWE
jgi:NH3-dependent NAD+ synthetase